VSAPPMPIYAKLALVSAAVVATLAMVGSSVSLYVIACTTQMALPLALPASLDLPAVVAATAVHARRRDLLGWFTLIGATVASTGVQMHAAAHLGRTAMAVHGAPPIAALLCFELAMRALRPASVKARTKPATKASETVRSHPETSPAPALPAPPLEVEEPAVEWPALAVVLGDDEIAERVDEWLAQQDPPRSPSKASVRAAGAALNLPCRGNDRAIAIAALVRTRRSAQAKAS
jgi:hypothetical protein